MRMMSNPFTILKIFTIGKALQDRIFNSIITVNVGIIMAQRLMTNICTT